MTIILFVCHGNICRSPMAEYILKDMATKAGIGGRVQIASAAVSSEESGNPVYPPARRELRLHGISCEGHAAHQITRQELLRFDRVYYMDADNGRRLRAIFGSAAQKCRPLLEQDVADPWYTGDFTRTWEDISRGCNQILEELLHE